MKKILLGLVALSSLGFAEAKLFDFSNAKIVSATKFDTEADLKVTAAKSVAPIVEVYHNIGAETTLYEFVKLHGNVKYVLKQESNKNDHIALNEDSSVGVELKFRQYGKALADVKYSKEFSLGYINDVNVYGVKANAGAKYILNYADTSKLAHKSEFKLGANYDVLSNLNVFSNAKLNANFSEKKYSPEVELGLSYTNVVKSVSKIKYAFGQKEKNGTQKDQKEKYNEHSINLNENLSYEFKGVKNLVIKPEITTDLGYEIKEKKVSLNLEPKVSVKYYILKGLEFNGSISSEFNFGKYEPNEHSDGHKNFTLLKSIPKVGVGLSYQLN